MRNFQWTACPARLATLAVFALFANSAAFAAAFSSESYSVSGLGNAYAGSVTGAHDHTDMFFNPAALSRFNQKQLSLGAISTDAHISTAVQSTKVNGVEQRGNNPDSSPGQTETVPNFYFSMPLTESWNLGLSVTSPFNLNTAYPRDSGARFHGVDSRLESTKGSALLSYKVTPQTSLGFGLHAEDLKTHLNRFSSPSNAFVDYSGSDTAYGYSLGVLSQLTPQWRVGASYQSKLKHVFDGQLDATTATGAKLASRGTVDFTMPAMLTLGVAYQASDKLELVADTRRTQWSSISKFQIDLINPPPGLRSLAVLLPFRNSILNSVGANYTFNNQWLLRTGFAYEKEAVTDDYRNPRFPVGNRYWLSFGARYNVNKNTTVDVAYVHQFMKDTVSHIPESPGTASLDATYKQSNNLLGLTFKFSW